MSDSIVVRVQLGAFDYMHPSEQHTQVVVQIPEVARASYLLPGGLFDGLKGRAWPEVVDVAHEHYAQSWAVGDRVSESARAAVHEWLRDDANRDEMQAAYEADQARRHPVARKLLKENEELRARVAELEALTAEAKAAAFTAAADLVARYGAGSVEQGLCRDIATQLRRRAREAS